MTNPFENETDTYYALINDEEQYSLWPTFLPIPAGWRIVCVVDNCQACLNYININSLFRSLYPS